MPDKDSPVVAAPENGANASDSKGVRSNSATPDASPKQSWGRGGGATGGSRLGAGGRGSGRLQPRQQDAEHASVSNAAIMSYAAVSAAQTAEDQLADHLDHLHILENNTNSDWSEGIERRERPREGPFTRRADPDAREVLSVLQQASRGPKQDVPRKGGSQGPQDENVLLAGKNSVQDSDDGGDEASKDKAASSAAAASSSSELAAEVSRLRDLLLREQVGRKQEEHKLNEMFLTYAAKLSKDINAVRGENQHLSARTNDLMSENKQLLDQVSTLSSALGSDSEPSGLDSITSIISPAGTFDNTPVLTPTRSRSSSGPTIPTHSRSNSANHLLSEAPTPARSRSSTLDRDREATAHMSISSISNLPGICPVCQFGRPCACPPVAVSSAGGSRQPSPVPIGPNPSTNAFPPGFMQGAGLPLSTVPVPVPVADAPSFPGPAAPMPSGAGYGGPELASGQGGPTGRRQHMEMTAKRLEAEWISFGTTDFCALAKTFYGSRLIQNRLEIVDVSRSFFTLFFGQLKERVYEVMTNKFGRFAFEKLLVYCRDDERLEILQNLAPQLCTVACDTHGSFGTQVLVKALHTEEQLSLLVKAIQPHILKLITDYKGHYLVVVLLTQFPYAGFSFIDRTIIDSFVAVANNNQGLQVMKAVFKSRTPDQICPILEIISKHVLDVVEHQYGNYVVQQSLSCASLSISHEPGSPADMEQDVGAPLVLIMNKRHKQNLLAQLKGRIRHLSQLKFASNVVEFCLKTLQSRYWTSCMISELLDEPAGAVKNLINDSFGNYVLQTALLVANQKQLDDITQAISIHLPTFRNNLRNKWIKLMTAARERLTGAKVAAMSHQSHQYYDQAAPFNAASPPSPAFTSQAPSVYGAGFAASGDPTDTPPNLPSFLLGSPDGPQPMHVPQNPPPLSVAGHGHANHLRFPTMAMPPGMPSGVAHVSHPANGGGMHHPHQHQHQHQQHQQHQPQGNMLFGMPMARKAGSHAGSHMQQQQHPQAQVPVPGYYPYVYPNSPMRANGGRSGWGNMDQRHPR